MLKLYFFLAGSYMEVLCLIYIAGERLGSGLGLNSKPYGYIAVVNAGFPRAGTPTPEFVPRTYYKFGKILTENYMKMKEIELRGGMSPCVPLGSTNALYCVEHVHIAQTRTSHYFCKGQEFESESVPESVSDNVYVSLRLRVQNRRKK